MKQPRVWCPLLSLLPWDVRRRASDESYRGKQVTSNSGGDVVSGDAMIAMRHSIKTLMVWGRVELAIVNGST